MANKRDKSDVIQENVVQAIVIADTFEEEFFPITEDLPLALLPFVNRPLIDYTLEFLSLGGVQETFIFCCNHVDAVKTYIKNGIEDSKNWSTTMKVNVVASESCYTFGDCIRDIYAKELIRGNFVLVEAGVISNIDLLPILKKHNNISKMDRGLAATVIYQESGFGKKSGRSPLEEVLVAIDKNDRILFHSKLKSYKNSKIEFAHEMFLENAEFSLVHNLKDTHISVCSPSVLSLFADNFDFGTKDDFIKGLLMNEEILGSTIYGHVVENGKYGNAVSNWQMYQTVGRELIENYAYPILPRIDRYTHQKGFNFKKNAIIGKQCNITDVSDLKNSIIGDCVSTGRNVDINNSFIFSNSKIEENVKISFAIVGENCVIKSDSVISRGTILGNGVVIEKGRVIPDHCFIQAGKPESCKEEDIFGERAYKIYRDDEDDVDDEKAQRLLKLKTDEQLDDLVEEESDFSSDDEEELSHTNSPVPDDMKFFGEVMDSLTRGFEDELPCDILILEINASRHAYNISVKEVNFNVVKVLLTMSLKGSTGQSQPSLWVRLLSYFCPILNHYINSNSAMIDCLEALEDVATSDENGAISEMWAVFVLEWLYDKDIVSEEEVMKWFSELDKGTKFRAQISPFIKWLEEAEEESD